MNDDNETEHPEWFPATPPYSPEILIDYITCSYSIERVQKIFAELGIHCFDCPAGIQDNLQVVARLHEMNEEKLIQKLNNQFQDLHPLDEPSYFD